MHLVDFNLREATAGHIFVLLLVAIEKVSGIDANADGPLGQENEQSAQEGESICGRKDTPLRELAVHRVQAGHDHEVTEHECHGLNQASASTTDFCHVCRR